MDPNTTYLTNEYDLMCFKPLKLLVYGNAWNYQKGGVEERGSVNPSLGKD